MDPSPPGAALPNPRDLHVLCEVARRGSLSAAGRAAYLSQPAVSQAIGRMERAFAARLFDRTGRGVVATPAGTLCIERAARALEQLRLGVASVRAPAASVPEPWRAIGAAQLEALDAVVRHGTFGRAAGALGLARATVHRSARKLELAVRATLFESTSHGVRPTRDAGRLARGVRLARAELAQARAEVAALAGVERGRSVIGAMPLARSQLVPATVLAFADRRPGHAIEILDGPYETLLEALRGGRADVLVGALRERSPEDVVQERLFDDPLAIVARAGHPLAAASRPGRAPSRRSLAAYAWIAPRQGSPLREHFEALVQGAAGAAAAPIECNSLVAARALLVASDRLMLLSARQVHHELSAGELVALPHPDGRVVRTIGTTVRRDWRPTGAQQELLAILHRVASKDALSETPPSARVSRRGRGTRAARRRSGA